MNIQNVERPQYFVRVLMRAAPLSQGGNRATAVTPRAALEMVIAASFELRGQAISGLYPRGDGSDSAIEHKNMCPDVPLGSDLSFQQEWR
jgi:hypothetical protein